MHPLVILILVAIAVAFVAACVYVSRHGLACDGCDGSTCRKCKSGKTCNALEEYYENLRHPERNADNIVHAHADVK